MKGAAVEVKSRDDLDHEVQFRQFAVSSIWFPPPIATNTFGKAGSLIGLSAMSGEYAGSVFPVDNLGESIGAGTTD
jgi:hypothetical protein